MLRNSGQNLMRAHQPVLRAGAAAIASPPRCLLRNPELVSVKTRSFSGTSQLGNAGAEVLQLDNRKSPQELRSSWPKATFSIGKMKHLLDHDNHEVRDRFRDFFKQPLFQPRFNMTMEEERELALKRLQVKLFFFSFDRDSFFIPRLF